LPDLTRSADDRAVATVQIHARPDEVYGLITDSPTHRLTDSPTCRRWREVWPRTPADHRGVLANPDRNQYDLRRRVIAR
jgi:hypothetical protein